MTQPSNADPAQTWQHTRLHQRWLEVYRSQANLHFYQDAMDAVVDRFHLSGSLHVLDAGCGSGIKSLLLARRGFAVTGIDVSPAMLNRAGTHARELGVDALTRFETGNIADLPHAESSFDCVLCWGVLMHIEPVESALLELIRVTRPGGYLILSEGNQNALQSVVTRWIKAIRPRANETLKPTPAGLESWVETPDGAYLTRQADIRWIIRFMENHGCVKTLHRAGELTEWYTKTRSPVLQNLIHALNRMWFHAIRLSGPAFGNLLVFQKKTIDLKTASTLSEY